MDGHIPAFGNCYMLLLLRLRSALPEKSLALFLEPNEAFIKAAELLLSVFLHGLWVKTPATTRLLLSLTGFGWEEDTGSASRTLAKLQEFPRLVC